MMRNLITLLLAGVSVVVAADAAQAQTRVQFSTGVDYSSGSYGELEETNVIAVPFSSRVSFGDFAVRASIPFLSVDGPSNLVFEDGQPVESDDDDDNSGPGGGGDDDDEEEPPPPSPGDPTAAARSTEQGFGDLTLSAIYTFDEIGGSDAYLDVTGSVRLPTGDSDKGLGIDATDYGIVTELGWLGDSTGFYVLGGRRFRESTDFTTREDGWQAGVGASFEFAENASFGVSYDWRESSTATGDDPSEVGADLFFRLNPSWRVGLNASAGLSDASPDYAAGVRLTWRALRRRN